MCHLRFVGIASHNIVDAILYHLNPATYFDQSLTMNMDSTTAERAAKRAKYFTHLLLPRQEANLYCRRNYKDTITVIVGHTKQSFVVHKAIICVKSPFFKNTTIEDDDDQNEVDSSVHLKDVYPKVFQAYLHWIYASDIDEDYFNICIDGTTTFEQEEHQRAIKL